MIEKRIKNEQRLKQYRRFKKKRLAVFSLFAILLFSFFSYTAEIWSNSKPLILSYQGRTFFPVLFDYHPEVDFGITSTLVMDYRKLELSSSDWALWPLNEWDPFEINKELSSYPAKPSPQNLLGTDANGRDIFARLLYGFRYSMTYAVSVWLMTSLLAIFIGGSMGYFGGRLDIYGQRIVEVISAVPFLAIILLLVSIFQPGLLMLILITSFFGWIFMSAYIRGEFLKNRKKEFVEAAKAVGAKNFRVIFKHILPNSLGPVITFAPFLISTYIVSLAGLDYLGLGLQAPTPSWGEMLNQAQKYFSIAWWLAVFPSLALFITLVLLSLVGDGVRDALDPKQ